MATLKTLVLDALNERHPGITEALASFLAEAAIVCLDRHHQPPAIFEIDRAQKSCKASAEWIAPDERAKRAHANEIDATEAGAYCVALAAVEITDGLVALGRAETGTGADYYVGDPSVPLTDFEGKIRLEVSGIDKSTPSLLKGRLAVKISQSKNGASSLPALAAVVGFSSSSVLIAEVEME